MSGKNRNSHLNEIGGAGSNPVQPVVIRRELFKKMLEYWRDNLRMCYDGSIDDIEMVSKLDREKYKELYDYHECLKLIK